MITILKTIFAFITPLIDKFMGKNSEKAQELKAQRELEELRAFSSGRIPPRFILFYCLIGLFTAFSFLFIGSVFFPDMFAGTEISKIRDLIDMGSSIIP